MEKRKEIKGSALAFIGFCVLGIVGGLVFGALLRPLASDVGLAVDKFFEDRKNEPLIKPNKGQFQREMTEDELIEAIRLRMKKNK